MRKGLHEQLSRWAARLSFSSLRARLLWLVFFTLLPAFGLVLYDLIDHQRHAVADAKADTLQLARLMAAELRQEVVSARAQLLTLAHLPAVRQPTWVRLCHQTLAKLLTQRPRYTMIGVLELNGDLRCSALPFKGRVNAADRTYFRYALETRGFSMGEYQIGRVSGRGSIHFGYPVLDETGRPQAVVFVALDLAALYADLIKNIPTPKDATFLIVSDQGTILAHYPEPAWMGKAMPESTLVKAMLAQGGEGEASVTGLDGVVRLYTFMPLLHGHAARSAYVSVGVPEAGVLAPAQHEFERKLLPLLLIAAVALYAAWASARIAVLWPVNALIDAATRLGRGNLSARTGLVHTAGELGQLARTFDEMADALEQGDKELRAGDQRFRDVVEATSDWIWEMGPDLRFTYMSDQIESMTGIPAAHFIGKTRDQIMHATADTETCEHHLADLAARRPFRDFAYEVMSPRGLRFVQTSAMPVFADDGSFQGYRGAGADITERKQAEQALRAAHTRLEYLLAVSPAVIYSAQASGDYGATFVSPNVTTQLGYNARDFTENPSFWVDNVHPDDRKRVLGEFAELFERGQVVMEYRFRHRDGDYRWMRDEMRLVRDGAGEPVESVGAWFDITERKQAEAALRESRERLLKAQRVARMGFLDWNLKTNDIVWSDEVFRLYGIDPQKVKPTLDLTMRLVHPDDLEFVKEKLDLARQGAAEYKVDYRILRPDGDVLWLHAQAELVRDVDGTPVSLLGTVVDITERKRAEAASQKSEKKFRALFETSRDAIMTLDRTGFLDCNQATLDVFGCASKEQFIAKHPSEVSPPIQPDGMDSQSAVQKRIEAAYAKGVEFFEWLHQRLDGKVFPAEVLLSRFELQGEIVLQAVVRDITGRKKAEEQIRTLNMELEQRVIERTVQLTAANQELEAFSYSVSHDLRAPLRAIDGFSQALLDDYADKLDDQGRDHLKRVRAATQRMGHLIDDLLKLARVTRVQMHRESIDLSALAGDVLAVLQRSEPDRRVECHIEPGLAAAGDARLLRVVLDNLLGNAWKFTGKTANARIEFGAINGDDGAPSYFVRDNGAGFDMTYADKLFGPFQRLHTPEEFPGTGVGLATVQRIVHRHGGRVWTEGAVGKGATFHFTL